MLQGLLEGQQTHEQQQNINVQQQKIHAQQQYAHTQQQGTDRDVQQWRQPAPGYVKCNVDASFYSIA
jgi:hypothetical protein